MKKALLFLFALYSFTIAQTNPQWVIYNAANSQLKTDNIKDIEVDRFNRKWILSDSGLSRIEGTIWINYTRYVNGIDFTKATVMTADNNGDIWLGGYIGSSIGVVKFTGNSAVSYTAENSPLPNNYIHSIHFDANNKAYILCGLPGSSYQQSLVTFDGTTWKTFIGHFYYNDVGEIATFDNDGYLWMAENFNLWKFKDTTYTQVATGTFGSYMSDIEFDSVGNLWIAKGGVGGSGTVIKYSGGIANTYPYKTLCMAKDGGAFWLGGYSGSSALLVQYKDNFFTEFTPQNSQLPNGSMIVSLKTDHWGNKWIALKNAGLAVYRESGVAITPVELTSFTASIEGNAVSLNWNTTTELNNSGFEVERSNGKDFSTIGFIAGHGTTTKPVSYSFTDDLSDKNISGTVLYRLKQIDNDGTFEYSDVVSVVKNEIPSNFSLEQNYPNPFNPSTVIKYQLPAEGNVTLKVYNNLGEEVALLVNEFKQAGIYTADFSAANLPSGIYYYRLTGDNGFTATKKMSVIK